jgi:membrane associated rhomboid family serine protease
MSRYRTSSSYVMILGRPYPMAVVLLAVLTFALSLAGGLVPALLGWGVLIPGLVWQGDFWRMVTWVFFETGPVNLLIACFMIVWLGRDLSRSWGPRRFLAVYLTLTLASAVVPVLLAPLSIAVQRSPIIGAWAVISALVVAWGLLHADQQILLYFILPISGRNIVYLTIGLTVLYAVFAGPVAMLPYLVAQGVVLVWLDGLGMFRRLWLRARLASYERELRRHTAHLRVVRKDDHDSPSRWVH